MNGMKSKGAQKIANKLDQMGVEYREEFTFNACRDRRLLPFDFIIIVNGKVGEIEMDGAQHFHVVNKFHGHNVHEANRKFELQQQHDITKNIFTRDNHISLLRISYKDEDKIDALVENFVNEMKKSRPTRIEVFSDPELYKYPYGHSAWCTLI